MGNKFIEHVCINLPLTTSNHIANELKIDDSLICCVMFSTGPFSLINLNTLLNQACIFH